jgi:hypothetical protein
VISDGGARPSVLRCSRQGALLAPMRSPARLPPRARCKMILLAICGRQVYDARASGVRRADLRREASKDKIQEGRAGMKTATLTRLEHEFDDEDWDEDDDEDLPGTDDEELDFDELEEEDSDDL